MIQKRIVVGGGGSSNPGLLIYRSGETTPEFIPKEDILANYEDQANWCIRLAVSGGSLVSFSVTPPVFLETTTIFDGDAQTSTPQSFFCIPVVLTIGLRKYTFDVNGVYRENIFCAGSKGAKTEVLRRA